MSSLLEPEFVRELEALRRRLEVRARSGRAGDRAGPRRGASVEFLEHSAYAPGDDVRRIDWSAYARSGEPVLKVFRADEDAVVRVLVDVSASMGIGKPAKLDAAVKVAAAVGYVALARGDRVELVVAAERISAWRAPARGRAGLAPLLEALSRLEAQGRTALAAALGELEKRAPRPGMLLVVSDFFDEGPVLAALARAAAAGHDVRLVQVVAPEDEEPALHGDLALEDAETGATVDVTVDAELLSTYAARLEELYATLAAQARRSRGGYVRLRSDAPLEHAVRGVISREVAG